MKTVITFSILFFLTLLDSSGKGIQKRIVSTCKDSICDQSIKITGKLNTVHIVTDSIEWKNNESKTSKPKDLNTIEINGKSNSVVVNQKKGDKVKTIQNGTGNQINISQSKSGSIK